MMDWITSVLRIPLVKLIVWGAIGVALVAVTSLGILCVAPRFSQGLGIEASGIIHVIEAAALVVAAVQIVVIYGLSRSEAKWRKLLSYHEFFSDCPVREHRQAMMSLMKEDGFDGVFAGAGTALSTDAATAIFNASDKLQKIKLYLDGFEQLSSAIQSRVVDEDYAFHNEATRVVRAFTIFEPLIVMMQKDNLLAYIQFEQLADTWKERRDKELSESKVRARKAKQHRSGKAVRAD